MELFLLAVLGYLLYRMIRYICKERYFASDEFVAHKAEIASVVAEHNDVAEYTAEIRSKGSFEVGASERGLQSNLATFDNTSQWNYRRDRNLTSAQEPNVHPCSLQVARNASGDPLKYVMKYFDIKADEPTLEEVETLGETISRLESAVANLKEREASITQSVSPPSFILKHYEDEFMAKVGVDLSPITVPYPVYVFEYVSAGGNSSQRTTVALDSETIDAFVETLASKIKFKKSAAGQRALMTAKLRDRIKERDNHTCRDTECGISVVVEPHLLLEVDHIRPMSKGGLSVPENLQTLCWRCNRTKSNSWTPAAESDGSTNF